MTKTTLHAHIYIVNTALILFFSACAAKAPQQELALHGKLTTADINKDGKPDRWTWSEPLKDAQQTPVLIKEEADFNFDRKIDFQKKFSGGVVAHTAMDFDFDGHFDQEDDYEQGQLVKSSISQGLAKHKDTWKFFEHGKLKRIEKDTNHDTRVDVWMYFEDQQMIRKGQDFNFDGTVDNWEDYQKTSNSSNLETTIKN